jgi:hypothetical protein
MEPIMRFDPDHAKRTAAGRNSRASRSDQPGTGREGLSAAWFDTLADAADRLARVIDSNAELLQLIAENQDHYHQEARVQAARNRRLAAALRDASAEFQSHRVPSDEIREIIRNP